LKRRWLIVMLAMVLFAVSVFEFKRLGAEFVPQLDEGSTVLMLTGPTSVGLDTSLAQQKKAERILLQEFPEISHIFSRIGTAEVQTDPMGPNLSDTFIFFRPREKWRKVNGSPIRKEDLAEQMAKMVEARLPGLNAPVTQPIEMRFNELLEGARADVALKIVGEDF